MKKKKFEFSRQHLTLESKGAIFDSFVSPEKNSNTEKLELDLMDLMLFLARKFKLIFCSLQNSVKMLFPISKKN